MTSHAPSHCCTVGVKHEGTPSGELKDIGNVSTYFAHPKSGDNSKAVLILPDVIGHKFVNAQLIADQFAANGYLVAMPDLFEGDPIPLDRPESFNIQEWLKGHGTERVDPIIKATIAELKKTYNVQKIGGVGYCFGGKYVARFMAEGQGIDVGYTAHPSFMSAEELKGIKGPLSIAAAETDHIFPAEKRRESEDILKEMGATYQMTLFSGVEHGFAVRADIKQKHIKFAKEAAFEQAVTWFNEYL